MSAIKLQNVCVEFPIYNSSSRSLKNRVLSIATGGKIERRTDRLVIVRGLDNVSLAFRDGDRVGLIGHNGSGKTTLLRVLSGIYTPTHGSAVIDGHCVSLININLGIDPDATGRENIRLRSAMMGMPPEEIAEKFDQIADFSGLGEFLDVPFRTYSSGMQLRLAFATSTAVRPEILIMDEWLSTGDEDFKDRANARMRDLVDSTKILVLASHSKELMEKNCNRVIWLEHGRVKMDGTPAEILPLYFGA
ncbi:ABC transporter ATP-binding protein [Brucella sp. ZJ1_1]|uniref:Lipopolysaccharide transport system ATP-binding protein n=2 Tax=Brucella intermedia TaxID=94625 RepID=A0ABR6AWF6_9HYPH|nr:MULTISPECIES: ABC transporter ATP-binding protein [Brucella/Ochrobactrum group]KAB2722331.1 ABC transporter ATP-binding protein [Brucella intermedia]MBA8842461.1 lipopolysaccharide transport system ATP-binding protein [Ochrobactrum sp. RH1CCR137]MBA8853796.1 lipopolysaccharide transport system ATP-binding protein [Brucella intermedia]MBA8854354.1 lipopolysaccharide transport system ATP-binding protein [Ochrobactrum sp. RH1CCR134]MBB3215626.1 lipopolysaccharide transport system ATP-binding p